MIACSAVNRFTPEESLARLLAAEPLPVGERLARRLEQSLYTIRKCALWWRLTNEGPRRDLWRVSIRAYARPLRHARERALHKSRQIFASIRAGAATGNYFKYLRDENARLRASLNEAIQLVCMCGGSRICHHDPQCDLVRERLLKIAEGKP